MATGLPITFASQTSPQMPWLDQMFQAGVVTFANIAALRTNILTSITQGYVDGYVSNADGGEGLFEYVATDTTSADNSGTIIIDAVGQRWYRSNISNGPYSVQWFGAAGNGSDATTAIQNAAAAMVAGGELIIPAGTYGLSSTITIAQSISVIILGTIEPATNAVSSNTPFFNVTNSNVTFDGKGVGTFNGISASFMNWDAIHAIGPSAAAMGISGYLSNIAVKGLNFTNMGLGNTAAYTVFYQAVDVGYIGNLRFTNCGVTNTFVTVTSYNGVCVYGEFCRDLLIENVTGHTVGGTFVLTSACLRTIVRDSIGRNVTLFAYKSGYGSPLTCTSSVVPTTATFSVGNTNWAKAQFAPGMHFLDVSAGGQPLPASYVATLVDNGTYLAVTTTQPLSSAFTPGDSILPMDTGTLYERAKYEFTGLDGFDLNGMQDVTLIAPYCRGAGMLTNSSGHAAAAATGAIWIGFDAYSGNNGVNSNGVTILGADIEYCYGDGIATYSATSQVTIDDYRIANIGVGTDIAGGVSPTSFGIASNKFNAYREAFVNIGEGTIITPQGGGISDTYSTNLSMIGPMI